MNPCNYKAVLFRLKSLSQMFVTVTDFFCQTPVLGLGLGVDFTFAWDNNNNNNDNNNNNKKNPHLNFIERNSARC